MASRDLESVEYEATRYAMGSRPRRRKAEGLRGARGHLPRGFEDRHRDGRGLGNGCRLRLRVPAGGSVEVESEAGDVEVSGLSGNVTVAAEAGDVTVRDVGGDVKVEAPQGDVTVSNVNTDTGEAGDRGRLR